MPTCGYHLTAKPVSFGKGQSAVHTAAYNARSTPLEHEREAKQTNDYSRAGGLLFSGIFAPKDAPEWARDRQELWNRAEAAERQWNGRPARNIVVAFPHQLDQQQREWMLKDFVREAFVRKGMVADVNMHAPHPGGDDRNYHAHILLTMREIDGDGFAKTKNRDWNKREMLEQTRERWAELGGRMLERAGFEIEAHRWKNGHRTIVEQQRAAVEIGDREFAASLDREATQHRGPHIDAMERRGFDTERANIHRDTVARNDNLSELKSQLRNVDHEIDEEQQQRQGRWVHGPQSGGRVEQEAYAMEQARKAHERPREEHRPSSSQPSEKHKVEAAQHGVKERTAAQLQEERARSADSPRELERDEERQQRLNSAPKSEAEHKIDVARFRSDPDYRREVRERTTVQLQEERARSADRPRELERDDRQR
jgi:hypothetical protein